MAGLGVSLGIAIVSGLFTGYVTSRKFFLPPPPDCLFDDRHHWIDCNIEHEQMHELRAEIEKSRADTIQLSANKRSHEHIE